MRDPLALIDALAATPPQGLEWQPLRLGVEVAWLYRTGADGPAAAYLRYQPGAQVPWHRHRGYEHILVLAGSQTDQNGVYTAGTLVVNPPGSGHSLLSEDGCLVLAIWERPVAFGDSGEGGAQAGATPE